ncbi:senescence domain-containing protein [Pseudoscourfieldia marina]
MNQKTNKKPADDDVTANRTSKAAAYAPKANYNPDKPIASILSTTIEKIDEQLDRVEEKPLSVSETMFRVADGPLGREASKVAQKAAKGVASVGGEALGEAIKIGTPVAKKGAGMLFKAAVELSQESERRRKEEKKNKK